MRSVERVRRAPIVVFAVVQVVAFVTWLTVGRGNWFYIDEWDFLAGRKAGDLGDVFRPHNGHWTSLPVLTFRLLYALFGLRVYVPYRVTVIVLYLVAATLLLFVMRRARIDPWIATAAASLFALFGAGWENIVLPFQITFTGSLAFGLAYLLLADHDGPFDRRDAFGLGAGLCALMCSGVGLVMVVVVGAAVAIRRGWRLALFHLVPMAGCYVIWLLAIGHTDSADGHLDPGEVVRFVGTGLRTTFGALGPFGAFGVLLAVVLVGGLVLVPAQRPGAADRASIAAPAALLFGALVLLVITAVNRAAFGADWARQSRYVSLVAALTLPALAVAADAVARRWRWFLPVAIALFLVGIPANIHAATREQKALRARDLRTRLIMTSLPHDPLAPTVPRSLRPEPTTASAVTIGWLLDAAGAGKLPGAPRLTPDLQASNRFRLSFAESHAPAPDTNCRTTKRSVVTDLRAGDRIGVHDDAVFLEPDPPSLVGLHMLFAPAADTTITVLHDVGPTRATVVAGGVLRICVDRA